MEPSARGLVVSLADKIKIARRLDEFGMAYVEGGWPGSNPKDVDFFAAARSMAWKNAKLAAFGSTRHRSNRAETDPNLVAIVAAGTPVVTIFGKSWLLHVRDVLGATPMKTGDGRRLRGVPARGRPGDDLRRRTLLRRLQGRPGLRPGHSARARDAERPPSSCATRTAGR